LIFTIQFLGENKYNGFMKKKNKKVPEASPKAEGKKKPYLGSIKKISTFTAPVHAGSTGIPMSVFNPTDIMCTYSDYTGAYWPC
jgi:hypothetical protein